MQRIAFRGLAGFILIILLLECCFLCERVSQRSNAQTNIEEKKGDPVVRQSQTVSTSSVCLLIGMGGTFTLGCLCVYSNTAVILQEIGFSQTFATGTAISIISLFNIIGKYVMGAVSDKVDAKASLAVWYLLCIAASCYFCFYRGTNMAIAIVGLVLIGWVAGIYTVPLAFLTGRLFRNEEQYARIISYVTAVSTLCSAFSGFLFHSVYDNTGTYYYSMLYATGLSIVSVFFLIVILMKNKEKI